MVPEGTVESAASSASGSASPPKARSGTPSRAHRRRNSSSPSGQALRPPSSRTSTAPASGSSLSKNAVESSSTTGLAHKSFGKAFRGTSGGQDLGVGGSEQQKTAGFYCAISNRPVSHQLMLRCSSLPGIVNASGVVCEAPS